LFFVVVVVVDAIMKTIFFLLYYDDLLQLCSHLLISLLLKRPSIVDYFIIFVYCSYKAN